MNMSVFDSRTLVDQIAEITIRCGLPFAVQSIQIMLGALSNASRVRCELAPYLWFAL
jgi:hypothetical protein